jgi:hypothetical protein
LEQVRDYLLFPFTLHLAVGNNYIVWLTSSVAGLEILFAVIAQSISKGKGDSFVSRAKICIKKE